MSDDVVVNDILSSLVDETNGNDMKKRIRTAVQLSKEIETKAAIIQDISKPYRIIIQGDLVNGSSTRSE